MLTYSAASGDPAYGQILVDVEDYARIDPLLPRIFEHVESHYPDSRGKAWQFALGPGGGSLIEARFTGPDPVVLRRLAERAKAVYAREGAVGIQDDWGEMVKVVRPRVDERNARRVGLSQGDVSKAIAAHFDGSVIGLLREGSELHPIIFRPVAEERSRIEQIREVQVFSPRTGRYVPDLAGGRSFRPRPGERADEAFQPGARHHGPGGPRPGGEHGRAVRPGPDRGSRRSSGRPATPSNGAASTAGARTPTGASRPPCPTGSGR